MATATAADRATRVVVLCSVVASGVLLISRIGYVPIWDGRTYADCMVAAADSLTRSGPLRCIGHASHAYVAAMALTQLATSGNYPVLLLANALLFAVACIGYGRLIGLVFPDNNSCSDRDLLLAAFVVQPAFLAAVVQPSLDLPLLPGVLWCMVWLWQRRLVAVALTGLAMTFTKETGLLLYVAVVTSYGVCRLTDRGNLDRPATVARSRWLLISIPPLAFAAYIAYRALNHLRPLIGTSTSTGGSFLGQLLVPRLDLYLVNFFILTLILNFAWIPAATIAIDTFVTAVNRFHNHTRPSLGTIDRRAAAFVVVFAVVAAVSLSRFVTYGNSRYYLVSIALLPVLFLLSLYRLRVPLVWRWATVATYVALLLVSNVRTIDPVSRGLYGTFDFGRHRMLHMTRVTGECCGMGQDQLAYSLEFTAFHFLVDDALVALAPSDSSIVILPDSTSWLQVGPLDERTHHRTLRRTGILRVPVSEPLAVLAMQRRPPIAYYLALPNGNNRRALADLATVYHVGPARRFNRGGYALAAYVLRSPARVP